MQNHSLIVLTGTLSVTVPSWCLPWLPLGYQLITEPDEVWEHPRDSPGSRRHGDTLRQCLQAADTPTPRTPDARHALPRLTAGTADERAPWGPPTAVHILKQPPDGEMMNGPPLSVAAGGMGDANGT